MDDNVKKFGFVTIGLLVALAIAIFASPFASSFPDGLEWVAEQTGFLHLSEGYAAWTKSPVPDYEMPGVGNPAAATALAGLIGTIAVFLAGFGLAKLMKSDKSGGSAA